MMKAGYPKEQAVAAAYSKAGKKGKKVKTEKKKKKSCK